MSVLLLVLVAVLQTSLVLCQDEQGGVLCTDRTCKEYVEKIQGCPIVKDCNVPGTNHSGLVLPSGPNDPCNCCPHCLRNLKNGEKCDPGSTGGTVPDHICGPGLVCDSTAKTCRKMNNEPACIRAQNEYDENRAKGTSGHLQVRPECDSEGFYKPYKCIPGQTCFCLDKVGNRIFGEIPFTNLASLLLKCECSRKYNEAVKMIGRYLHPQEHFRCTQNGDYDTIQCIGDKCMCTDSEDGAPSDPDADPVNIANITAKTLKNCFDSKIHLERKFHYECAQKHIEIFQELEEDYKNNFTRVFGDIFPNCDLNGKYAPVQKDTNRARCVYPEGKLIGNYTVTAHETNELFYDIDCKCARTNSLIREGNLERPQCCPNGNFNPIQCRRGLCRCVDSDGYQIGKEVNSEKSFDLKCCKEQATFINFCGGSGFCTKPNVDPTTTAQSVFL